MPVKRDLTRYLVVAPTYARARDWAHAHQVPKRRLAFMATPHHVARERSEMDEADPVRFVDLGLPPGPRGEAIAEEVARLLDRFPHLGGGAGDP